MIKKLSALVFLCIAAVGMAFGQSLQPTMQQTAVSKSTAATSQTGRINLPKSSIYSQAPQDLFAWVQANGTHMQRITQRVVRRISASDIFPDDPYIYGVLCSTYKTVNEGYEQGQVLGFYLNSKTAVYKEMSGEVLPTGGYGQRFMYVRVADKWYTFDTNKVTVSDVQTGALLKEAETDVANASRGATYDYNRKKFYIVNFSGLIEVDPETFESTNLGALPGGFVTCLAAAPDGLYYITYAGQLYKYDFESGEGTQVLSTVKVENWQNQGMCAVYDWATGDFYYAYLDNGNTEHVVKVDLSGEAAPEHIVDLPGVEMTLMGIYLPAPEQAAPAPAKGISFDEGVLKFTVPTTAVNGESLTGALKAYVTINGEETAYDVTVGETASFDIDASGSLNIAIEIGNDAGRSAERKVITYYVAMPKFYANDPYVYGVLSSTYKTENEGFEQGQVLGFYLNSKTAVYKEMNGAVLPTGDYGSRLMYVRVGDKWYTFDTNKVTVSDAKTGAMVKEAETDVANAGRGATYDYNRKKFYIVNFSGLIEVDPETFESIVVCTLPGGFVTCLAAAPDGLYYITYAGQLYKYDFESGEGTQVLSSVKVENWQNQGMCAAYDWANGEFYYAYIDNNWTDHVVKVDLSGESAAEHVVNLPGRELTLMGLYVPAPDKPAPAPAENIDLNADGVLTFTVPTKTVAGEALTGDLTAIVTVNGVETTYDVTAGETKTIVSELNGNIDISIVIANAAGRSAERKVMTYIGTDVPNHVTDLVLSADDGENFQLTWNAPTSSQNGGPIDDASLNYTVTRMPDEVVVAEGLKATSFSEPIPARRGRYYYVVDVYTGSIFGATWESNIVSGGTRYEVPFMEQFTVQDDFDQWTIIDKNEDGNSWHFQLPWGSETGYAWLTGNGVTSNETGYVATFDDDYFISLPVRLVPGTDYRLRYDVFDMTMYSETMEVLLGKGTAISGDEQVLEATHTLTEDFGHAVIFNVAEEADYHVIFHVNTVGNSVNICIDNVGIDVFASFEGPGPVTDVSVVAGERGAMTNTLTFTAPAVTYKGAALEQLSRIEVYRNDEQKPAKVFENPAVGETLTWTDEDMAVGYVDYRILPFNEAGQGEEVLTRNWVGVDIPANVELVKFFMDENQKTNVEWKPVGEVGAHGGYVDPAGVKYTLCRYEEWNWDNHWPAVTEPTTGTTAVDADYEVYYGQQYVNYIVVASNEAGSSSGTGFGIVLGEPYETPYTESFPYAYASQDPWTLIADGYNYAWHIVDGSGLSVKPYDFDGGMLQFQYLSEASCDQRLTGPRVSLKSLEAPELSFFMYHGFEAEPGELSLDVYTNTDDEGWVKAATVDYNNGGDGWCRYALPLKAGADNVQIAFGATAVDASAAIYVDQIKVDASVAVDAAITAFGGEKRVEAGDVAEINVSVGNYGAELLSGYQLCIQQGDDVVKVFSADELVDIEANGIESFTFDYQTDRSLESQYIAFTAVVVADGDTVADNDTREFKLFVHNSNLPEPIELTGTLTNGQANLSWTKPATDEMPDAVTDGFDEYESFVIEGFGDWKTYDGDGLSTSYFGGPSIPNNFDPKAWQVWAPVEAGFSLERFDVLTPVSGDKYLACWAASDGISQTLPQDDWLISSDVLGGSDLSFWYRVPNDGSDAQVFEILYSTTDDEVESFEVLDRDSVVGTTDWVQFLYTLPREAKYFAIRNCSYGSYNVAFLDDITYTPLYSSVTKLTLQGYNVYRDNELLAEKVNATTFVDTTAGEYLHTYNVTAVYAEGESRYSNGLSLGTPTGIDKRTADEQGVSIMALDRTIRIAGAEGMVTVYTVDGKRIFAGATRATLTVRVQPGVFVVKAGDTVRKLTVK